MHELALSQSIVDLVLERARVERVRTVTRVVVAVGTAAGVGLAPCSTWPFLSIAEKSVDGV